MAEPWVPDIEARQMQYGPEISVSSLTLIALTVLK